MKEILNNICFSYDGIDFNVPINAPWEIYTGLVRSASEYDENIDRSDIDPYFILHLTERCNLKCKYCFEGEKGQRDISKETVNYWIEYIKSKKYKKFSIRFFGGEPSLRVDIIEYIINTINDNFPVAKGYDISYNIFTNAVNISDKLINLIEQENIGCFISMDACEKMHNYNRLFPNGKGSYDVVLKSAKRIQRLTKMRVIIRAVFDTNINNISLIEMVDECCRNGFEMLSIEFPWVSHKSELALNMEKEEHKINLIHEYAKECINRIKHDDYSLLSLYEIFKHLSKVLFNKPMLYLDACAAGKSAMAIDVTGDIYPCHSFVGNQNYILGNVKDGITNMKLKKEFEKYNCETIPQCKLCALRYYCTKRCFADSLWFNGDILEMNKYRCKLEKEFFEAALYIYFNIKDNMTYLIKTRMMIWQFQTMDKYK